ncbi:Restriction modification system DNA specificity domain protein [Photobacterium sp. SKA34]|uniref:restriction endonuclease subunit S n=1 Tax=Photobacterium sp. SKA34 TaxID=121723 RepID=UPI00006BEB9A|nr:restriction endonuclease subunit S [Photobacterium sp. SKA34]EAR54804.1 Restriction modification system DNA specificity domain protein [Photobacterium sp. SKA34]
MVPNGWVKTTFGKITKIGNGQVDPKVEPYSSMTHIGPENVVSNTGQITKLKSCSALGLISGKYEFDENSIVYSKIRPNLNKVCRPDFKGVCSADMYPIWSEDNLDINYLYHYMLGPYFNRIAIAMSMRTGMPKINRSDLNSLSIVLPPLPEQRKIAKILSTWDRGIASTEKLIDASKQQKKALMQQLLTGKKRLVDPETGKAFEENWERTHLKSLLIEEKSRNKDNKITRVLSVTNHSGFVLPEDQFSKRVASENISNYKIVKQGQFGYNPSRLNVGSFACLNQFSEGVLSPMYVVFSTNDSKLQRDYLSYWMDSHEAKQRIKNSTQGSVRESVGFDALCNFPFILPALNEQQKIASVLTAADKEIELLEAKLAHLKQEKKALMQQLLTGKRRVKVAQTEVA